MEIWIWPRTFLSSPLNSRRAQRTARVLRNRYNPPRLLLPSLSRDLPMCFPFPSHRSSGQTPCECRRERERGRGRNRPSAPLLNQPKGWALELCLGVTGCLVRIAWPSGEGDDRGSVRNSTPNFDLRRSRWTVGDTALIEVMLPPLPS